MLATSRGTAIAGTALFAVAWRTVDTAEDAQLGEIALDDLPPNPCWDAAMNAGSGGVRSLTDAEISAAQSAQTAAASQYAADLATVAAFKTAAGGGGSSQSNDTLTNTVMALLRLSGF